MDSTTENTPSGYQDPQTTDNPLQGFMPYLPREGITGLRDVPCYIFGNGAEIEREAFNQTSGENIIQRNGAEVLVLPKGSGKNEEIDIVQVHFMPKTKLSNRANMPELIVPQERVKISVDAMEGFISMASALKNNLVDIKNHQQDKDFYLFAATNPQFAAFLRTRCGFRGNIGMDQVWIKKSEFISDENIQLMMKNYQLMKSHLK